MTEQGKGKGGKSSKKLARARRTTHKGFVPRVHGVKMTPLVRHQRRMAQFKGLDSPFLAPFDNYLCRLFAYRRACGLSAPRG